MLPPYESALEAIYRSVLRSGDIAVDIGAHVGRHTIPMAEAVGATGKVFAFEPLPSAFASLKQAVGHQRETQTNVAEVITHICALGEEEGDTSFTFVPDFPEYSGFKKRKYHSTSVVTETINVAVYQLDSFQDVIGKARFIKIDAEGGELMILRGGRSLIAATSPIISFELGDSSLLNYDYTSADYFDFFDSLGYSIFSIFGTPLLRDEFISAAKEQFFWDYIALPNRGQWVYGLGHMRVLISHVNGANQVDEEHYVQRARAAEERLAAIYSSSSWRITAPFRRIFDKFRRV